MVNVGEVDVDVDLNSDEAIRQAQRDGQQAGDNWQQGFNRSLRDFQRQGARQIRDLSQNMRRLGDDGEDAGNRIRGSFDDLFEDTIDGLAQVRRRFLGLGVGLGPVLVPVLAILAEILPAIAVLLPLIVALGAGIAVVALSMEQLSRTFAPLVEGFKSLQQPIGNILTAGLDPLVRTLATDLIPVLERGLGAVARFMNGVLREFLRFVGSAEGLDLIQDALVGVAQAMRPLISAVAPFTRAFLTITKAALPAFQLLAQTIADLIIRFDRWIQRMARTGQLTESIVRATNTLIGVLRFLGNVFLGVNQALRVVFDFLAPIGNLFGDLGISVREAAFFITLAAAAFFGLFVPIASLISLVSTLGGVFAALGALFSPIGLAVVAIVAALVALGAILVIAWRSSEDFRVAVTNLGTALFDFGARVIAAVMPALQAFGEFFRAELLPLFRQIAAVAAENLAPAIEAIAKHIEEDLAPAVDIIAQKFREWWPTIQRVIVAMVQAAGIIIRVATLIIGQLIPAVLGAARAILGTLGPAIRTAVSIIRTMIEGARTLAGILRGPLSTSLRGAAAVFRSLRTAASGAMTVLGAIGGVIQSVGSFISTLISQVESLIDALGRIRVPDINLPSLGDVAGAFNPFARGGIIDRPTLAMMGEGFRPEAVVPMTRPRDALKVLRASGLDKLVLNNSKATTHTTTYAPTFNLYPTPGETPAAMMHRIDSRLRLRAGG